MCAEVVVIVVVLVVDEDAIAAKSLFRYSTILVHFAQQWFWSTPPGPFRIRHGFPNTVLSAATH